MLLVIKNVKEGKPEVVCQLLQVMQDVFEELEEDVGKVLAVMPGWEDEEISGPSMDDPSEMVSIPVQPAEEFGQMLDQETMQVHTGTLTVTLAAKVTVTLIHTVVLTPILTLILITGDDGQHVA